MCRCGMKVLVAALPLILCLCWLVVACRQTALPAGVVATVNGEPIYLHSLERLLDSRYASRSAGGQGDLEDMERSYAHALQILLAHALVRQELKQRGIPLEGNLRDSVLEELNAEAGDAGLESLLQEVSISKDDWEALMLDYLALETFRKQVLKPGLKVGLDEIRDYYNRHKSDFQLTPYMRACFLNAESKESLEAICKEFTNNIIPESPMAQCMDLTLEAIPQPWRDEQKDMKRNTCGKLREENGNWQSIVILSRSRAKTHTLPEVYALVENRLLEQKQQAAFEEWLAGRIAESSIMVAPELNAALGHGASDNY